MGHVSHLSFSSLGLRPCIPAKLKDLLWHSYPHVVLVPLMSVSDAYNTRFTCALVDLPLSSSSSCKSVFLPTLPMAILQNKLHFEKKEGLCSLSDGQIHFDVWNTYCLLLIYPVCQVACIGDCISSVSIFTELLNSSTQSALKRKQHQGWEWFCCVNMCKAKKCTWVTRTRAIKRGDALKCWWYRTIHSVWSPCLHSWGDHVQRNHWISAHIPEFKGFSRPDLQHRISQILTQESYKLCCSGC